jgi:hypothetical protein
MIINYLVDFVNNVLTNFQKMAHNAQAVYGVLAARISKHVVFAGPTKCGGNLPWE